MRTRGSAAPTSRSRSSGSAATTSAAASTRRRRAPSSTRRSTPASRSSTRPTSTATAAAARRSSAGARGPARPRRARDEVRQRSATARRPAAARAYIRRAIEASLRRLQTDWIDLYQYHRPDGVTPLEETLGALDELVREGKVRAIGSSNFTAQMVEEAHAVAAERGLTPFVSEQSEYSWLRRDAEGELLPACERLGVGFIPYFPLASGLLTGKYRRGEPAPEGTRLHGRELDEADLDRSRAARGIRGATAASRSSRSRSAASLPCPASRP